MRAVKRENPEDERAEASHPKEPADAAAPRGMSDDLVEGETLDVGDDPKSEEKKNNVTHLAHPFASQFYFETCRFSKA